MITNTQIQQAIDKVGRLGGGTIYAENYADNLYDALNVMLDDVANAGKTLDCTYFKGNVEWKSGYIVKFPCVILLGDVSITCATKNNVFTIESNNVQIIGINRTTDYSDTSKASTIISMTDAAISNDCDKGFHIYSKGNKCLTIANINFIGKKSTLGRQCNNATYPIDGYGGVYIEKAKPSVTESGNTCNATRIENCLISGTKHHGIYLNTGILSEIKDTRLNRCAGHGIFLNGGTTINLQNCYVASGNLAGYCIYQVTYCSVINCVAEEVGLGFWVRSSFNVTLHSPGIETTYPLTTNPWSSSQPVSGKYGFNMSTTDKGTGTTSYIKDVDDGSKGYFIGHGYVISGGDAINVFSPYAMGLQDLSQGGSIHNALRFIYIVNNARNVNITNARFNDTNSAADTSKHDIEINGSSSEGYPKGINLLYNPADSSFDQHEVTYTDAVVYGTNASSSISPVFVHTSAQNVSISVGTRYYIGNGELNLADTCPRLNISAGTGITQSQMDAMGMTTNIWNGIMDGMIGRVNDLSEGIMQVTSAYDSIIVLNCHSYHNDHVGEYYIEKTGTTYSIIYSQV